MSGYDNYLQKQLELKETELALYKTFIERELGCRIKVELETATRTDYDTGTAKSVTYKVITIPQSRYVIQLD